MSFPKTRQTVVLASAFECGHFGWLQVDERDYDGANDRYDWCMDCSPERCDGDSEFAFSSWLISLVPR